MWFLNAMNSLGNLILAFLSHIFTGKASWHWESPVGWTVIIIIWVILGLFIGGFFAFRFNWIVGLILTPFLVAFLPVMLVLVAIGYLIYGIVKFKNIKYRFAIRKIEKKNLIIRIDFTHLNHFHNWNEQEWIKNENEWEKRKKLPQHFNGLTLKEFLNRDFSKIRKHYRLKF